MVVGADPLVGVEASKNYRAEAFWQGELSRKKEIDVCWVAGNRGTVVRSVQ